MIIVRFNNFDLYCYFQNVSLCVSAVLNTIGLIVSKMQNVLIIMLGWL